MSYFNALVEAHTAYQHPVEEAEFEDIGVLSLRRELIREEAEELDEAIAQAFPHSMRGEEVPDEVKANILKEMADLLYVLWGMAVCFDLPLKAAFNRVHQSNMSKLGADGQPIYREDGKVLKGPNYRPPDMIPLVK